MRRSFRNAIPTTARRAVARARIASATVVSSTAYCESSTSCRSSRICLCIACRDLSRQVKRAVAGSAVRFDKRWTSIRGEREALDEPTWGA